MRKYLIVAVLISGAATYYFWPQDPPYQQPKILHLIDNDHPGIISGEYLDWLKTQNRGKK